MLGFAINTEISTHHFIMMPFGVMRALVIFCDTKLKNHKVFNKFYEIKLR